MKLKAYNEFIKGNEITHASILNARNIAFGLKEVQVDENDARPREKRRSTALSYAPDRLQHQGGFGDEQWDTGIDEIFVAYNSLDEGIIYCDTIFNTFEPKNSDIGEFYPVTPKPDQDDYTRLSQNIKYIDGELYITGILRKVFKRTGVFEWVDLTDPDEHPDLFQELAALKQKDGHYGGSRAGFSAIDGFSKDDIYAAGEYGDAWHYNGKVWRRLDLPGNFNIKTITCGGDGNVYFAGYTGGIIKGTIDHWKNIDERGGKVINETAWFQGKLYLSDERYLYTLEGDELRSYKYPKGGPQQYSFRGVAASKDALVAYGPHQALVFDGERWEEVIGSPALSGDA
jgi:hypothetical protein